VIVALDTNVLGYAEGVNGSERKAEAVALLELLPPDSTLIPLQALGELFTVLVRKAKRSRDGARAAVLSWGDAFPLIETSSSMILVAADLAVAHQLGFWDAMILSAAAEAKCRLLLSEDLQDGLTWSGVTVVNPFSSTPHKLLEAFLRGETSHESVRRPSRSNRRPH
jgi:predicted nucleic acid-binding protein